MAIIPVHSFFYDGLLLWLIPNTFHQSLMLSGLSWIAFWGWKLLIAEDIPLGARLNAARPWQLWLLYVPLLCIVLQQIDFYNRSRRFIKSSMAKIFG